MHSFGLSACGVQPHSFGVVRVQREEATGMFRTKAVLLFLLAPERFRREAVEYHERYVADLKANNGGNPAPFDRAESEKNNSAQATAMRQAFFDAFRKVLIALLGAVVLGAFAQRYLGSPHVYVTMGLQLVGAFMTLGATLWQIGDAASASRAWLAERVHNWLFQSLYVAGTFMLGLATSWDAFGK
jgi:hypothetical protein